MTFCDIHLRAVLYDLLMVSIIKVCLKFTHLKLQQKLPGANVLKSRQQNFFNPQRVGGPSYLGLTRSISLRRQDISSHDTDYIEYVGPFLTWGRILSSCVKSMWRNGIKCKYVFMFPLKNLARKELSMTTKFSPVHGTRRTCHNFWRVRCSFEEPSPAGRLCWSPRPILQFCCSPKFSPDHLQTKNSFHEYLV